MKIAIFVYDGFAALDAIGPYEVLASMPDTEVVFVARERGVVRTEYGSLGIVVDATFADVDAADILLLPGGTDLRPLEPDDALLTWIRAIHETTTWTTSVCTGALLLGEAGLLDGLRATTHWIALEQLRAYGAIPSDERVVVEGKIVTAAGVSSGIDMALTLLGLDHGEFIAQAVQLGIEYDPQPPYDAGSVSKAPPEVVDMVREVMSARFPSAVS